MKKTKTFFEQLSPIIKNKIIGYFDDIKDKATLNTQLRESIKNTNDVIVFLKYYKLFDKEAEEAIFPFVFAEKE